VNGLRDEEMEKSREIEEEEERILMRI